MKKRKNLFYLLVLCAFLMLSSCGGSDRELSIEYDKSLLIGKWKQTSGSDSFLYVYLDDQTGYSWLPSEDTGEDDDRQKFKWTLDKALLTQSHLMEVGEYSIPKRYIVTELTATTLQYKDELKAGGKSYTFEKVQTD